MYCDEAYAIVSVIVQSNYKDSLILPCNLSNNSGFVCEFVVFQFGFFTKFLVSAIALCFFVSFLHLRRCQSQNWYHGEDPNGG